MTAEHDARMTDRLIRLEIDPLLSGLSKVGKFELLARLMGELVLGTGAPVLMPGTLEHRTLPDVGERLQLERDGAASEAGEIDDDAATDVTSIEQEGNTNNG